MLEEIKARSKASDAYLAAVEGLKPDQWIALWTEKPRIKMACGHMGIPVVSDVDASWIMSACTGCARLPDVSHFHSPGVNGWRCEFGAWNTFGILVPSLRGSCTITSSI